MFGSCLGMLAVILVYIFFFLLLMLLRLSFFIKIFVAFFHLLCSMCVWWGVGGWVNCILTDNFKSFTIFQAKM